MGYIRDVFWHGLLRRPYHLAKVTDAGSGQPVILLHGIGRNGEVWHRVLKQFEGLPYQVIAFDLLGFGTSPKPKHIDYNVDDHAKAVISSVEKLRLGRPVVLVGHSMGCLVSVRVARLRPDLVKHMVLYEMPLYEGLPDKRMYRARLNMYYKLYDKIVTYKPTFDKETAKFAERMAAWITGIEITRASWTPFVRSLQHTIMHQSAAEDLKHLKMPIDVIYGTYDMLVIRGKRQATFGSDNSLLKAHTVRARHQISDRASKLIVARIEAAENLETESSTRARSVLRYGKRFNKSA